MPQNRWLISGATGQLGSHLVRRLSAEVAPGNLLLFVRQEPAEPLPERLAPVDLADFEALRRIVVEFQPTIILHVGAMTAIGECHHQPEQATRVNVTATRILADAATEIGARLIFTSTDMVFDGEGAPYRESDLPNPVSHYGRTKLAAERVLAEYPNTITVRLPLMYGFAKPGRETTFSQQIAALKARQPLRLFTDEYRTPIWLGDAARALLGLARSELTGLIHVAGPERLSRLELIVRCAKLLDIREPEIEAASRLSIESAEPRPADLSLDGERLRELFPQLAPGPLRAEVLEPEYGN